MTVNVRRRRRKIDPDHAKKKAIKKAGKTALKVGSSIIPLVPTGMAEALEYANKPSKVKKKKKKQVNKLYGDWFDSPSKAAKKKRKKFTGYSGDEII
tara:strand:+ start:5220 stop:5510 length:291 start_codon:yes stop_codon:yes gene_type:complete